ncbi:sugar O-acetyltransferase [Aureitalea marina]|uniref:Acetyltransferase n=1 Tax=Aureitalea marina TaxID=930804 RepID=A0A2S7KQK0_9FLAO|nr:sugar O-acetyltransferase [Aureitalea marina]PQB04909.1 maltose acetyltransferase [Aureitalea marina]
MTEKEKMLAGEMYDPLDPQLAEERYQARLLFQEFNKIDENNKTKRNEVLGKLIPHTGSDLWVEPPFYCDYGSNIIMGNQVFMNFNCCILDVMQVKMGDRVMLGPQVQIYTATHPLKAKARSSGREFAKPITIGNDVWIGGNATICPGVNIGNGVVIGAGSVVTKNIPDNCFAAGNPARVIREIEND